MAFREHAAGQRSEVWIASATGGEPQLVHTSTDVLLEAPNWSHDGTALYLNGGGKLWRLDVDSPESVHEVPFESLPDINNDHVLAPSGDAIYLSAMDGHIYRGLLAGGAVDRVSPDDGFWHFLHGVTSTDSHLAYVQISTFDEPGLLAVIPTGGASADDVAIVDTGTGHIDGPEWAPGDEWIYFNTEGFTTEPGHAQLARIPSGGGAVDRLLTSEKVDWFPHLSPDGRLATYISFPPGTLGHPADLDVSVVLVDVADWSTPLATYPLFGGQGTINVNSWAPTSDRFAYVAYPVSS